MHTTAHTPDDAEESAAGHVRAELARKRWTGRAAARELGWSVGYLNRRLTGEQPFDEYDLRALSRLLDVPVGVFFGEPVHSTAHQAALAQSAERFTRNE